MSEYRPCASVVRFTAGAAGAGAVRVTVTAAFGLGSPLLNATVPLMEAVWTTLQANVTAVV